MPNSGVSDSARFHTPAAASPARCARPSGCAGRGGNRLDDLCRLYGIDLSDRTLHGALIDSELLVQVVRELGRRGAVFGA